MAYRRIGGREEQVGAAYRAAEEGDLYERMCAGLDRDIRYGQTQNGPAPGRPWKSRSTAEAPPNSPRKGSSGP